MNRRGFALPFVIIAIGASAALALAFVTTAWRGHRAGRLGRLAEGVAMATDQVMAERQLGWREDSLWTKPLGASVSRAIDLPGGVHIDVVWRRSHPLVAWLGVRGARNTPVSHEQARRDRWRTLWLEPPRLPLVAALTTSGTVTAQGLTTIDGVDIPLAASPCGLARDAQDVVAVAAAQVAPDAPALWPAMPAWQAAPSTLTTELGKVLPAIALRSVHQLRDSLPAPLPVSPGWHALLLDGPVVVIQGPTHWRGLLTVRGALRLQGEVQIEGILVVRGPIDARNAQLRVRGAVLATDTPSPSVQLGGDTQLLYDRCAVQMALATVATPRSAPFFQWQATSP